MVDNSSGGLDALVHLEQVSTVTGEEDEIVTYRQRAKLYRFSPQTSEWKERGQGNVKFLQHARSKKIRLVMRQEKTLKVVMNHLVSVDTPLAQNKGSDRSWVWSAVDFGDGDGEVQTFAIKFKKSEIADEFKEHYDLCRELNDSSSPKTLSVYIEPYLRDEAKEEGDNQGEAENQSSSTPSSSAAPAVAKGTESTGLLGFTSVNKTDVFAAPSASAASGGGGDQRDPTKSLWYKILNERQFSPLETSDLRALWEKYDKDSSNTINRSKLRDLLSELMDAVFAHLKVPVNAIQHDQTKAELDSIVDTTMKTLGTEDNNSFVLTWDEFRNFNDVKLAQ